MALASWATPSGQCFVPRDLGSIPRIIFMFSMDRRASCRYSTGKVNFCTTSVTAEPEPANFSCPPVCWLIAATISMLWILTIDASKSFVTLGCPRRREDGSEVAIFAGLPDTCLRSGYGETASRAVGQQDRRC